MTEQTMTQRAAPPTAAAPSAAASGLARAVLAGLDEAGVRWCLLRGGANAPVAGGDNDISVAGGDSDLPVAGGDSDLPVAGGDIDILVAPADLGRALATIEAYGLIRLRSYGRGTHRFFLGLDPVTTTWVELDVVTELAFGPRFEIRTSAAEACLARRQRRDGVWVLAPEDEFWALLLHCVLDKGGFSPRHTHRLERLSHQASFDSPLALALPQTAQAGLAWLRASRPTIPAAHRRALLGAARRNRPLVAAWRTVTSGVLRLVERPLQFPSRRGISVALLGPDGSGKSTLAAGIESAFYFPVRRVYMGLWPSIDRPRSIPAHALRILARPFIVWRRYLSALRHRALGRVVVFDRYVYDALLPPRGRLVRLKRLYFGLLSRLCPAPTVVLLLDVPGDVMHARSGEYDPAHLEAERDQYHRLHQRIPHLEVVDANRPPELVLADAVARIWRHYVRRSAR